jgi:inositol hexakisphosphate/diphosphoinositol-pentakisphosphate kinase
MGGSDVEGEGKQVLVGICAMAKKSQSKPMKEILTRLEEFEYIKIVVFPEEVILKVNQIYIKTNFMCVTNFMFYLYL